MRGRDTSPAYLGRGCRRDVAGGYGEGVVLVFEGLLVAVSLLIVWFAVYVIVKLFKGQN